MSSQLPDSLFGEAFAHFDQALCYDEDGHSKNALPHYEAGLDLVNRASTLPDAEKSELYTSMMEAKLRVEDRLNALRQMPESKESTKNGKPMYPALETETTSSTSAIRGQLETVGDVEAELVAFVPDHVQLFCISGESTTVPTYPTSLQLLRFLDGANLPPTKSSSEKSQQPQAFIQVGPWIYPLVRGSTPILRNEWGAYVVRNPTDDQPDLHVGIMISPEADQAAVRQFDQLLRQEAVVQDVQVEPHLAASDRERKSKRIAAGLVRLGDLAAKGVTKAATATSNYVQNRSEKMKENVDSTTAQQVSVPPAVRSSLCYMHKGSKVVARCTRYMLDRIGEMGVSVGKRIAHSAEKSVDGSSGGGRLVTGTINVTAGGIAAASTVWMAMENASRQLCRAVADETVDHVRMRYGDEAGESTHDALHTVGHGSLAAYQLWDFGPRSIAGRMARRAGVEMVRQWGHADPALQATSSPSPATSKKT